MPLLRFLLNGLFAVLALLAAVFAAVVVVGTAVAALLGGKKARTPRAGTAGRAAANRGPDLAGARGDVIDVEATPVPPQRADR